MGTMRIARAEFIKIFKKPSLYFMGLILAIVILVSSFFFEPAKRTNSSVTLKGSTVADVIASFEEESGAETKKQYDLKNDQAKNMIDFYSTLTSRNTAIDNAYTALKNAYTALLNSKSDTEYTAFKARLSDFKSAVLSKPSLDQYKGLFDSYLAGPLAAQHKEIFQTIENLYGLSATSFCDQFNNNTIQPSNANYAGKSYNYKDALLKICNDSKNIYTNHLRALTEEMTVRFKSYATEAEVNYNKLPASLGSGYVIPGTTVTVYTQAEYFNYYANKTKESVQAVKDFLDKMTSTDQPLILISETNYLSVVYKIEKIIEVLGASTREDVAAKAIEIGGFSKGEAEKVTAQPLSINQWKVAIIKKLVGFNNEITSMVDLDSELFANATLVKIDDNILRELRAITDETVTRRDAKYNELKQMDATNGSTNLANKYVSQYKHLNLISNNIVYHKLLLAITDGLSNKEVAALHGYNFNTFSRYNINETLLKNQYLYKTNTFAFEYSDTFSFNQNSANKTTVFDFMFYALRISTLFIIVFAIIMASSIIASEFDTGTIKLLAIRPYRRGKIIMGKFFATMFFVICFVLFSAIISLFAGLALFDWNIQPVLAVFNSSVAFSISPILLMLINIICVILEIMFFAIIAICMATITRSFAATLSTTLVLYVLSLALNILLSNKLWYAYSPFMNIDFFRFMGGAFSSTSSSVLSTMFTTPLLKNMNFFISLGMYGGISVALMLLTYLVFKKKDI